MILQNSDIDFLRECAISAAYKAGKHISNQTNKILTVHKKEAKESLASQVFTQVDTESQHIILETLSPTINKYNLGLLTEESSDDGSRFSKQYFWAIDPLDGTLPYINKQHGYSVCIALINKQGTPIIGVVYDPLKQNIYYASVGNGAFLNNKKLSMHTHVASSTLHLYVNESFTKTENYAAVLSKIKAHLPHIHCNKLQTYFGAGAAMNACMVLEHSNACYFKLPTQKNSGGAIWDYAATACIFEQANGFVSNMHGGKLNLNRKESTLMNHKGILYATSSKIAEFFLDLTL